MIGVDTNILVYAHREEMEQHKACYELLIELSESENEWAIAWPSFYEFLRVVTHKKGFGQPTPLKNALRYLRDLLECTNLKMIGHAPNHFERLETLALATESIGNKIFDVQIAGCMLDNKVREIISADRDFLKFKGLRVIQPF